MEWFAINDVELRQFHMAGLVAGGGDAILPVINEIRGRKISYTKVAEKPTRNLPSTPLPTLCEITHCPDNVGPGSCKRGLDPETCTV